MVSIEIDGKKLEVQSGAMIIEAADNAGINIPRFCYHKKLSVAANCRMCLVEVDKSRKPLPACATPVTDGMKVFTQSEMALKAQKVVMEFLLINHPLDCPICDQGGECELQDVSMGYGEGVSRFTEGKRVVNDENIGPLISTDMTRCIHCTRCVRFGEEVAGVRELGATGRGEATKIGTFIKQNLVSEVSGNVIDLCPVGALTSKPYRFTARAWELAQHPGVAAHDCLGSNIYYHTRRQQVMRVIPKENESINETWLSDRDRYSYTGLNHVERLAQPMVKTNGQWQTTDWASALKLTAERLGQVIAKHGSERIGALASPSSTCEEFYLLQKLMRALGSANIDHRLSEVDFADQEAAPQYPGSDMPYEQISNADAICLIGSNIHREQPLAGLRVRKAVLHDALAMVINPIDFKFNFPVAAKIICTNHLMVSRLAEIAKALVGEQLGVPEHIRKLLADVAEPGSESIKIAQTLKDSTNGVLILGALAQNHPRAAMLRALSRIIAQYSGASLVTMTQGANAAGAWLAGAVPHRNVGGKQSAISGLTAKQMLEDPLPAYVLLNTELELDAANPGKAQAALDTAEFVVAMSPYCTETMQRYADVILPSATFAETSGHFVNLNGDWQSFSGVVEPHGEARPAWKILRVLGNLFAVDGFDYVSSDDVYRELTAQIKAVDFIRPAAYCPENLQSPRGGLLRIGETSIYATDSVVRRSEALDQSAANDLFCIRINTKLAQRLFLSNAPRAQVLQAGHSVVADLIIDDTIADNQVWLNAGRCETAMLGDAYGVVELRAVENANLTEKTSA